MTTTRDTALNAEGLARLQDRLQVLVGQPCSIVFLSYGGELRVGLGPLAPSRRGYINGEWTLGTRGSPWLLESGGKPIASERDDEKTWVASLEGLKGKVLERVKLTMPGPDLALEFEGGQRFTILPSKQPEWVAWELLYRGGGALTASCDGTWEDARRD